MTEHIGIITPEVIAIVIGLILAVGGAQTAGLIRLLRGWAIKGRNIVDVFVDISEDGKFTGEEIERFWKALQTLADKDPEGSALVVRKILQKNPQLAKDLLNSYKS